MRTELEIKLDRIESASWVVACNGQEVEFTKNNKRYIYMFNTFTKKHAHYCITDDVFLTDNEYLNLFE